MARLENLKWLLAACCSLYIEILVHIIVVLALVAKGIRICTVQDLESKVDSMGALKPANMLYHSSYSSPFAHQLDDLEGMGSTTALQKQPQPMKPSPQQRASAVSLMRSASSAALNVSAAAIGAPVSLMRTAAALTTPGTLGSLSPGSLVRSASAYVPESPRAMLTAALTWSAWPPVTVLHSRRGTNPNEETVRLEVKLLNGADLILEVPADSSLAESREQVVRRVGLPLRRQFFVVAEDRVRAAGLGSLAKSVTRHLAAPKDLRASLVSWINFIFLPEAVNRELYGRGLIGSLKATTWYQQLQEKQEKAQRRQPVKHGIRVQVETLAGQVVAVEVDASASLTTIRSGIEREVGIAAKQQRLIILERTGPGALTHVTNTLFLHSMNGARKLLGAAAWAGCTLRGAFKEDNSFPLAVKTHCGASLTLNATGDMTLDQVREMVEARTAKHRKPAPSATHGQESSEFLPQSPRSGSGSPRMAAGSPTKVGTPDQAERAVLPAGKLAAAASGPPPIALSEIGFPEIMPPRQNMENPFVRIVDI